MKRFWTDVTVADRAILLDQRPVRTPARAALIVPTDALAQAIADEWRAVGDTIDPRAMPLTGYANLAIDRVGPDPAAFAATLASYAETDTLVYGAAAPPALVERQHASWTPLLAWARAQYDVAFVTTTGIGHVAQPPATIARLVAALHTMTPFQLAGVAPLITIGGSLVAALMVHSSAIDAATAFAACHLDELWQAEIWGEEWSAAEMREARAGDFATAARFLTLLA